MVHNNLRRVNVFISSPGDVKAEREAVINAINLLNKLAHIKESIYLVPIFYEYDVPGLAGKSPQNIIDDYIIGPENSDVFICILRNKFGTPFIDETTGKRYESGTGYEFEKAYLSNQQSGVPHILMYRGEVGNNIDKEQYEKVKGFFQRFEGEKAQLKGLYKNYKDIDEFRDLITHDIDLILNKKFMPSGKVIASRERRESFSQTELREVLENSTNVDDIKKYLDKYPALLSKWLFGSDSTDIKIVKNLVFENHKIDFALGRFQHTTGRWEWILVILGNPDSLLFSNEDQISRELGALLLEANSHRSYIQENLSLTRKVLADVNVYSRISILIGQRKTVSPANQEHLTMLKFSNPGIIINTYDSILDLVDSGA